MLVWDSQDKSQRTLITLIMLFQVDVINDLISSKHSEDAEFRATEGESGYSDLQCLLLRNVTFGPI